MHSQGSCVLYSADTWEWPLVNGVKILRTTSSCRPGCVDVAEDVLVYHQNFGALWAQATSIGSEALNDDDSCEVGSLQHYASSLLCADTSCSDLLSPFDPTSSPRSEYDMDCEFDDYLENTPELVGPPCTRTCSLDSCKGGVLPGSMARSQSCSSDTSETPSYIAPVLSSRHPETNSLRPSHSFEAECPLSAPHTAADAYCASPTQTPVSAEEPDTSDDYVLEDITNIVYPASRQTLSISRCKRPRTTGAFDSFKAVESLTRQPQLSVASQVRSDCSDSEDSETRTVTDCEYDDTDDQSVDSRQTSSPSRKKSKKQVAPRKRVGALKCCKRVICKNCGASQTPQWRCGPEGPRTLCNACGVRYKKGLPLQYWEKKLREERRAR